MINECTPTHDGRFPTMTSRHLWLGLDACLDFYKRMRNRVKYMSISSLLSECWGTEHVSILVRYPQQISEYSYTEDPSTIGGQGNATAQNIFMRKKVMETVNILFDLILIYENIIRPMYQLVYSLTLFKLRQWSLLKWYTGDLRYLFVAFINQLT